MTKETLEQANNLYRVISNLEAQIKNVEEALRCVENRVTLDIEYIDRITITGEFRSDILDMVLMHLNKAKDKMKDALRML